jgi:hypothetical protein
MIRRIVARIVGLGLIANGLTMLAVPPCLVRFGAGRAANRPA